MRLSVALFLWVLSSAAWALPLYTAREGRTCDNCHTLPNTWKNPEEIKDRKCTMSCSVCHIDPSGGGLRNVSGRFYGQSTLPGLLASHRGYKDTVRFLAPGLRALETPAQEREEYSAAKASLEEIRVEALREKALISSAEESLRQAETMSTMGRLAARIAHEINNPLAGIQSAFLLIKDAIPASHPHVKYVGAIEREVARISQVTQQLYETYRPETESSHHAAVQTVVSDAVVFLEQVNRNTGVRIVVEFGGIAAVVRLSESILRQCVYNLVQNAIEASPAGATVTVIGSIEARDFVLRVRDAGPGVPIELRERVFDPFVSTKPSQLSTGGMGLGLALVRRAVEAAGGSVEIGDAPDGGAEFIVIIPLAELPVPGVTV